MDMADFLKIRKTRIATPYLDYRRGLSLPGGLCLAPILLWLFLIADIALSAVHSKSSKEDSEKHKMATSVLFHNTPAYHSI